LSAHGLSGSTEKVLEGALWYDEAKLLVEHDERLANGVDDAVGSRTGLPRLLVRFPSDMSAR